MILKVGSKGEEVKKIQIKLGTTADGDFGPGTEKLVKEWQTKNGLLLVQLILELVTPLNGLAEQRMIVGDENFQRPAPPSGTGRRQVRA
jgi:peptidoglycan hydrolase-like protein with peptidoglycan-binding domain